MNASANDTPFKKIYSVSELTSNIKKILEEQFSLIWVSGEISNFRKPVSGHFYFTLKDESSQISSVMFRGQNRSLKFDLEDGMMVMGIGRVSVYEPRGSYQIILEYLEPMGAGAIQAAFEQTKKKLAQEGLFDEKHKRPLPFLPNKINIITSSGGAVIHDILKIINRRFPNIHIQIVPVRVQGDRAEKEIIAAIELVNQIGEADVIILARGGGSLEDLYVFNLESVARAVFISSIPVISAIGHETDFTITDFVADLRAPTPSSAAELVVPLKSEINEKCRKLTCSLESKINQKIHSFRTDTDRLFNRLVDPRKRIDDMRLRHDETSQRLFRIFLARLRQKQERLVWRIEKLRSNSPLLRANLFKEKLERYLYNLSNYIVNITISESRARLNECAGKLQALSPLSILSRGYSITRTVPEAMIVRDVENVQIDQNIEVLLGKGSLICKIKRKKNNGKTNI